MDERVRSPRPGRRTGIVVALGIASLFCRPALAQPNAGGSSATRTLDRVRDDDESGHAELVLVGMPSGERELGPLCAELLGRQRVRVNVTQRDRFEPDALFGADRPGPTRVFIVLRDAHSARLHFRGPSGERYLIRSVSLPNGLDAVGRELLAQVVESAVMALLHSNEGLSREEASAELKREGDADASAAPAALSEPSTPAPAPERSADASPATIHEAEPTIGPAIRGATPSAWEPYLLVRYSALAPRGALAFAHGPGVAVGIRFRKRASAGIELGATRWFEQSLDTPALRATVARVSAYALVETGWSLGAPHAVFVGAGPAVGFTHTKPVAGASGVELGGPRSSVVPALRFELRYAFETKHWLFGAAALLEFELVRTRYELEAAGARELLATPAPVSLGAALSAGFR